MVEGPKNQPEYRRRRAQSSERANPESPITEVIPATENLPDGSSPGREPPRRTRVMLLGSGEAGRELVVAFQRLGVEVIAVDRDAEAPLHGIADRSVTVKMTDADELAATIAWLQPQFVVTATDLVAADALTTASETGAAEVVPSPKSARLTADREGLRRLAADELGLPTAPFWFAGSVDELAAVAEHAGFPMVVKPVAVEHGEGESVILRPGDVEAAWHRAVSAGGRVAHNRVLAETVVEVDYEVTLLTVRGAGHAMDFCAPIGHRHIQDGGQVVLESWQPQPMSPAALDTAKSVAARIVNALGGRGVFGVELLVRGDEVYFSDVTARPYDTALVSLRTQRLSEFELQARAILGLATDTIMISPGAARLVYSSRKAVDAAGSNPDVAGVLADALAVPESDVVVYTHHDGSPRHRLGVAVATAPDVTTARVRAGQVAAALSPL